MESGFGLFALRFSLWPRDLDRGAPQEPLGDRPRCTVGLERHLDLRPDRLAIGGEGLGELVLGPMAHEEGCPQRLEQCRFSGFVGLDDDVEAIGQAFDRHRLAKLAEAVHGDPAKPQAHAFSSRLYSTNRRSSACLATDAPGPPASILVESFAAATPSMPSTTSCARSSSLGRPTRSLA